MCFFPYNYKKKPILNKTKAQVKLYNLIDKTHSHLFHNIGALKVK